MFNTVKVVFFAWLALAMLTLALGTSSQAQSSASGGGSKDRRSISIVFEDGHRQSFPLTDIARIEFNDPAKIVFKDGHQQTLALTEATRIEFSSSAVSASPLGRNHFVGKWRVGISEGGGHFYITLNADGSARKTLGSYRGTWTVVDGEARIAWNDGWHDVIRRSSTGSGHEKVAREPGKSFSDEPTNVADATRVDAEPI